MKKLQPVQPMTKEQHYDHTQKIINHGAHHSSTPVQQPMTSQQHYNHTQKIGMWGNE